MYSLIIVDDEDIIRHGLEMFFADGHLGFKVVGCFEDGREALEFLRTNEVDAVITDICMEDISGLRLARYVKEEKMNTKVVLLSGFKEFEYAQAAINYDVESYMLKPVHYKELSKTFEDLRKKLDIEKTEKEKRNENERYIKDIVYSSKLQILSEINSGIIRTRDELLQRTREFGLKDTFAYSPCCLLSLYFEDGIEHIKEKYVYGIDRFDVTIKNFIRASNDVDYYFLAKKNNTFKILAVDENNHEQDINSDILREAALRGCSEIQNFFNLKIVLYTDTFPDLLTFAESSKNTKTPETYIDDIKEQLVSSLVINDKTGLDKAIAALGDELLNMPRELADSYLALVLKSCAEANENIRSSIQLEYHIARIKKVESTVEAFAIFKKLILSSADEIKKKQDSSIASVINTAKDYINRNYTRDISLSEVAEYVYLSPMYFSRVFKQYVGETFTDYIIQMRINKAIELLDNHELKSYEIAEAVGYPNAKYFIRLFKEHTGLTPKEMRRNKLKKAGETNDAERDVQ